jgi:poly-beta-1,6-N-acetyl-D-glucosamine synthase
VLKLPSYVIVSPARNEERSIELTIQSVVAQTVTPLKWVIVSDGSTDRTDEIVKEYAAKYPFIELLRMPERKERHFAGKVFAFKAGQSQVKELPYEVIVSLDADITFERDYFEFLLTKLASDARLGLVGTPFRELTNEVYDYRFVSIEHVSGACQVFRRECYEDIGGYTPVKGGAIDNIAVISARMKGWKTRTFTEMSCLHHRAMGTAQQGAARARFKSGGKDYAIGNHPLWEAFRSVYQMTKKPFFVGGLALGAGYLWAYVRRAERPVSVELMRFLRREQMLRLKDFFHKRRTQSEPQELSATRQ